MTEPTCLIIVPRGEPDLLARLIKHFADDPRILVRADARHGDREARELGVFAVGGGDLPYEGRAWLLEQITLVRQRG